jgi:oligopeptide/dipeptide ABC transporter ATP-binding protein
MSHLLEVIDLSIEFQTDNGNVQAVRGISFALDEGEILGMVGESGCGKSVSTLALLGLIQSPGRITSGKIMYQGKDLLQLSNKEWRTIRGNEIAMIFQDPMTSLNPFLRISDQLMEVLSLHTSLSNHDARKRCIEVLEAVGIPDPTSRMDAYPHQFSGGMRQRVMIAMALAAKPKILLADEPTTALDVTIQDQILDVLAELQEKEGVSILFITHDLGVVASICNRVQVMYAGKIVESASTDALFSQPRHPYTKGLLASVPRLDQPPHSLKGIPGQPPILLPPPPGCAFAPRCFASTDRCYEAQPDTQTIDKHDIACFHHEQLEGA